MEVLDNYPNIEEAMIIKGMLESNDIPCMVEDDNNLYVPVFGGVTIYVREEDLQRARDLLASHNEL